MDVCDLLFVLYCFFYGYGDHRDLHVLTHSFPTRRSSDLNAARAAPMSALAAISWCSAASTSGRRVSTSDGRPAGSSTRKSCRSEEHTSELQSLMRISYAVFCLKKTNSDSTTPIPTESTRQPNTIHHIPMLTTTILH